MEKITRTGIYGIVLDEDKIFLVIQNRGPFKGLFDLPGGGLDFGESVEEALHREFLEETATDFLSMHPFLNVTVCTQVPASKSKEGYLFFQIGLIYKVEGLLARDSVGELTARWVRLDSLSEKELAPLAWKAIQKIAQI
ncbi:NUDIX domain-containing protein [bacterium]|nr:NUDIX domain-containing protein [Chlamydiota bacterium]NDD99531.1 NUDIX domain-containing protein [bacterium]